MKYPLWKPILIILVLALFGLILEVKPLRKGLDLAGGTTLIYDVKLPEDADDPAGMIDDLINVLRTRIDPNGIRNLQWRRVAGNRVEIQMALAGDEIKTLRQNYVDEREALLGGNLDARDVDSALRLEGDARTARFAELAGGDESLNEKFTRLVAAYDAMAAASEPYQDLQQQYRDAEQAVNELTPDSDESARQAATQLAEQLFEQMQAAARDALEARKTYQRQRDEVLTASVGAAQLQRVLDLPKTSKTPNAPTRRAIGIDELKKSHPSRADEIDKVVTAYEAYEEKKGPLDDPNDLIAMLQGAGVLEFRIAATMARPGDVQSYREQLQKDGPRGGAGRAWKWFEVDDIDQFAETQSEKQELEDNAATFFAGNGLIGDMYADEYYLLLADTADLAMTKAQPWELTSASVTSDQMGKPAVAFNTDVRGAKLMAGITGPNVGDPMAILLDGKVMSAPRLNDKISGRGIITGDFSRQEIGYLVRTLKAGSTEAELGEYPISIKTTGPLLGQDNLKAGLEAAVLALAIVAVFMLFYYFFLGLVADFALVVNMMLILGVMAMFEATFTLPGIAGIVLTIGMAVDANVLIFERIREELEAGAELKVAVRQGYGKALSTILDANITTLITCVVLFNTATADIKGFAQTLMIGIFATLFTALFCTHVILDLCIVFGRVRRLPMLPLSIPAIGRLLHPKVNWISKRYAFMVISAILIAASVVLVYERGEDMLDIEFRSGTQVSFNVRDGEQLAIDDVRTQLDDFGNMAEQIRKGVSLESLSAADQAVYHIVKPVVQTADARHQHNLEEAKRLAAEGKDPGEVEAEPVDFTLFGEGQALVVTEGDSDGQHASAFKISTLITDSQAVSDAVKAIFADSLAASQSFDFAGMEETRVARAPVYAIRTADLGANINRPDVHNEEVSKYLGGVAIVLDKIEPAATVQQITERVAAMRMLPAYENITPRDFEVIPLDLAGENEAGESTYHTVVLVSTDKQTNYTVNPDTLTNSDGLADTEWRLVRDALTRDTSLASVTNFSSQVSGTMKQQAIVAMVLSLLAVVVYVWFRFGSLRYGLAAIAALVHDVTIALGLLAGSYWVYEMLGANVLLIEPFKINIAIVAAVLTIIGYSLNDTIVVFDRIRENRGRLSYATPGVINDSINQTVSRTLLTSGTTLLALLVLYIVGGAGVHGFAFAMILGVLVGTYSSIAVASPLLLIKNEQAKKAEEKAEE